MKNSNVGDWSSTQTDNGLYIKSFLSNADPRSVVDQNENFISLKTFDRTLYENNQLPNIEGTKYTPNPSIDKNIIMDNDIIFENQEDYNFKI